MVICDMWMAAGLFCVQSKQIKRDNTALNVQDAQVKIDIFRLNVYNYLLIRE